ncbi:MAG: acylphosphatase, partial [Lachnospiraceae bacterium]|nr:acylphosphatase [Lachnospiraceae bacterium]
MRTLRIYGLVQGVGFRPYVAALAEKLHILGTVQNAGGIVIARIEGQTEAMEEFSHRLHLLDGKNDDLPGARVDYIETEEADSDGSYRLDSGSADPAEDGFRIIKSDDHSEEIRFLPPDIATCDKCASELLDTKNRRYRYPFISCFSCGPRYTIMKKIPYDREHTTMAD